MVEQPQAMENITPKENEDKQQNRIKATFSLLDHAVKAYNNSETYIKRGLTLFGLGSVIAGASFSVGQNVPSDRVSLSQNSDTTPTSNLTSTSQPQQSANSSFQQNPPQPQVIYVTPPSQPISVHNIQPINPPVATNSTPKPVNTSATSAPENVSPKPVATNTPAATNPTPKPVNIPSSTNLPPISEELSQVKETVDSVQQISGAIAGIKKDITPLFGEQKD